MKELLRLCRHNDWNFLLGYYGCSDKYSLEISGSGAYECWYITRASSLDSAVCLVKEKIRDTAKDRGWKIEAMRLEG